MSKARPSSGFKKFFARFAKKVQGTDAKDAPLRAAVVAADAEKVKALIAGGANPNHISAQHQSPLSLAIGIKDAEKRMAVVTVLLAAGANPAYEINFIKTTPLSLAVLSKDATLLEKLLDAANPADVDIRNSLNETPYITAVALNNDAMADMLEARGAKPDVRDGHGYTPLHYAAARGNAARVEKLLQAGVSATARSRKGHTPLQCAKTPEIAARIQSHIDAQVAEWQQIDNDKIAQVQILRGQGYRLTSVFNFKDDTYTLISHNYKTGQDSVTEYPFQSMPDKTRLDNARAKIVRKAAQP